MESSRVNHELLAENMLDSNRLNTLRYKGLFIGGCLMGIIFSALFTVYLNKFSSNAAKNKQIESTKMVVAPPVKQEKTQQLKKPKPKPNPVKSQKPNLSNQLANLNFGGGGINWLNTSSLTDKIGGDLSELAMTADTVDVAPSVVEHYKLDYPASARNSGTQGFVTISFLVTKTGEVKKPKIIAAEPEGVFESYALASLSKWKFKPASYEGKAVKVWTQQTIRFDLN